MKRVLILDANQRSALATTRSLGKHGIPSITADDSQTALAGRSRYSEKYFQYPSPKTNPEQFIEAISKLASSENIQVILPMTELTSTLLLLNKGELPCDTHIPFANLPSIEALSNKCSLMALAKSLSIPTPQSWFANNPDNLPINLKDLAYPVVLKPEKSWLLVQEVWMRSSVRIANDPIDAESILNSDPAFQSHPFMLQEYVSGHGQGVFALYDNGNAIAFFNHKRIREKPPWGGVSVFSESVPIDPVLQKYAKTLLDSVNWHGVAMVEFKVTTDGTPYLMEINTRFWGSLQLAIDAGVDFPWLLYNIACSQPAKPITHYKTGIRLRWLIGDLDNLYLTLKDKELTIGNKLQAIACFFTPSPFKTKHEVNRWHDMGPFFWECRQYLKDILK